MQLLQSSTSGLLISEIAKNAKHPERFVGGHPYNPPHLIPLVEITKGEKQKKNMFNKLKTFIHLSIKNLLFFKRSSWIYL